MRFFKAAQLAKPYSRAITRCASFNLKDAIEMAVRYLELSEPPQPMPSGWAGLLYLYDLR